MSIKYTIAVPSASTPTLRRRTFLLLGAGFIVSGVDGMAQSTTSDYPTRPITLVVPFPPGGPVDFNARLVARKLSERLRQPVIIENKPGASASIGTEYVARAKPDGYTLLVGTMGTHALNLATMEDLRYDPVTDFVPLETTFATTYVVLVHPDRPYVTLKELIAYSRKFPGKINMALAGGPGTANALAGEILQKEAGIKWTSVAYKGNAPALQDLLGGTVDMMFGFPGESLPHVKAGKLRALAVTHEQRLAGYAEVPTMAEEGYKGAELTAWIGCFAPARTPKSIVEKLIRELDKVVNDPEVQQATVAAGQLLYTIGGPAFEAIVKRDAAKWRPMKASR